MAAYLRNKLYIINYQYCRKGHDAKQYLTVRQITVYSITNFQFLAHSGKSSTCPIVCECVCEMSYCD